MSTLQCTPPSATDGLHSKKDEGVQRRTLLKGALALAAGAGLAGCGGVDRAEAFTPSRLYAYADSLRLVTEQSNRLTLFKALGGA